MIENILVGIMVVILVAAAVFAWKYENGNSGIIEESKEHNDVEDSLEQK